MAPIPVLIRVIYILASLDESQLVKQDASRRRGFVKTNPDISMNGSK